MSPHEISAEAMKLLNPVERSAYIAKTCAGDAGLQSQVEALLPPHADSETLELQTEMIA